MDNPTKATRGPKIALMGGIAVLAIAAIVYFSFFYPPTKNEDVSGTIGAAKKYRSEQITDKDVKLEGQTSDAIATGEAIADVQAAHEFAATASAFENAFKALDNKVKLDAAFRDSYQRTSMAMNNIAKALESAPKNSYDARAVSDLRNSAAALERAATAAVGNKSKALDRAATMDLGAQMKSIDARAMAMQAKFSAALESRASSGALDSRPSASIDAQAKIDAKAQSDQGNKVQGLDNKQQ